MTRFEGNLARQLDFGAAPSTTTATMAPGGTGLRLAPAPRRLTGPDKYRILHERLRRAQIAARRLLDLCD